MKIILPTEFIIQNFYKYAGYPKYNKYSNIYMGGCPSCLEGKSWGKKRRLCYIPEKDTLFCHNCQKSWNPLYWIKEMSGQSFKDIINESKQFISVPIENLIKTTDESLKKTSQDTLPLDSINLFDKQQIEYYKENQVVKDAIKLIVKRRLHTAINKPKALFISLKDPVHKNRLCIPFYDIDNQIQFYQTRAIYKEDEIDRPKYLSKMGGTKTVFGVRNIDSSFDTLFIFEGPIDSFFVKNALAVGGIHISDLQENILTKYKFYKRIWILDNQLDNKDVLKKNIELINRGETIFIWPKKLKEFKDVNDICVFYKLNEIKPKIFIDNSYNGEIAKSKLVY